MTEAEFDDPDSRLDYLAYVASSRYEPEPIPFGRFCEEWRAFQAESGAGREYLAKLDQVLREFSAFASSTADMTPMNIARYVRKLENRGLRRASISSMLYCIRSACSYAINRRYIAPGNPLDAKRSTSAWMRRGYKGGAAPKRPAALDDAVVAELLSYLHRRSDTWEGHRLYVLTATGLLTGLRSKALLTIRRDAVDLESRIIDAGPRPFRICDDKLAGVLAAWLPRAGCDWLFPGVKKLGPWTGGVMGTRPLDQLKAAGASIGVDRLTFESLRSYWFRCDGCLKPGLTAPTQPAAGRIDEPCGPSLADRSRAAWDVELGKLSPKQARVIRALAEAGDEGATGATISVKSAVPGWREILVNLADSGPYWRDRIVFPLQGGRSYKINMH